MPDNTGQVEQVDEVRNGPPERVVKANGYPSRRPMSIGRLAEHLTDPGGLAVAALAVSVLNALGQTTGGVAARLADTVAAFRGTDAAHVTEQSIAFAVTASSLTLAAITVVFAVAALWRADDVPRWWQPVASAALVLALVVAGVHVVAQMTPPDAGFSR